MTPNRVVSIAEDSRKSGSAGRPTDRRHFPLDILAKILQQMETISHLLRVGCAASDALRVEAAPIAADELNLRPLAEPVRCRFNRAGLQHVHHLASLEIHDDGSVSRPFAPAPVVDRNRAQAFVLTAAADMLLQPPENRGVADLYTKLGKQAFADQAAGGMAKLSDDLVHPPRLPGERRRNRNSLRESLSGAQLIAAFPTARAEFDHRMDALDREILQSTYMPAMPRTRRFSAIRAGAFPAALGRHDPTPVTERHALHDYARAQHQFRCLRHPADMVGFSTTQNPARKMKKTPLSANRQQSFPAFWRSLETIMPDYESRVRKLDRLDHFNVVEGPTPQSYRCRYGAFNHS